MAAVIQVEKDTEGLQEALSALFEESFIFGLNESVMRNASTSVRVRLADEMPPRTLSPGYYRRAQYLLNLERSIEIGCTYDAHSLTRDDVAGLEALHLARNNFEREHFPCGRCGARQHNRFITTCRSCDAKFTRSN
jgi:hypothetical protein